jgi:hypothetical protein
VVPLTAQPRTHPIGEAPEGVVGDGRATDGHLEGVLLAREDVKTYLNAGIPGLLGEREIVIQQGLGVGDCRNMGGRSARFPRSALTCGSWGSPVS